MNKDTKKIIDQYYIAVEDVTLLFIDTYFFNEDDDDCFWIGGQVGGGFSIADMYFSFEDILTIIQSDMTFDEVYDWYYWSIDHHGKTDYMNLKTYLKCKLNK